MLLGFALLRILELAPTFGPSGSAPRVSPEDSAASGHAWEGTISVAGQPVRARLEPFHGESGLEEFRSRALAERLDLEPGLAWRLLLWLEPSSADPLDGLRIDRVEVRDRRGPVLSSLSAASVPVPRDPTLALLAQAPGPLRADVARPVFLWGRVPDEDVRLALVVENQSAEGLLAPVSSAASPSRWFAGVPDPQPEDPQPEARSAKAEHAPQVGQAHSAESEEIARLRSELARERGRRMEREQAFEELGRQLAELALGRVAEVDASGAVVLEPEAEEDLEKRAADEASRARAEEIAAALRVLMRLEGIHGLDLLEPGTLQGDAMGPVVFRCLDERGLLCGSIGARGLRLEGSRAAHTLTLVLEDGFESRAGVRQPFEGGMRRITLAQVDPDPWFERCPELFRAADLARVPDDGRWDGRVVRQELNRLLALDAAHGWYRLHSLGGVSGGELVDVQLEELEPSGRLVRRFFADRLALTLEDGLLVLVLKDGATVRGDQKEPFRSGILRIVVPGAALDVWRACSLPGLSEPPGTPPETPPGGPGEGPAGKPPAKTPGEE